jgi:predicted GNAT family acetyltransferase
MCLKDQAGWNQTEADWLRFLDLEPAGCFVAEWAGHPVGTTTTCLFGCVAWIAMVLVDQAYRGRGIATALMSHAVEFLENQGARTIRLDATPLGKSIYERLGFVAEFKLARYEGTAKTTAPISREVEPINPGDWKNLLALDRETTGTDRKKLLDRMLAEYPETFLIACHGGMITGYLFGRPGTKAFQIGPCLTTPEDGPPLLSAAFGRHTGTRVFIDIPEDNAPAVQFVEKKAGFIAQRQLLRMRRGQPLTETVEKIWASSGPEMG